MGEVPTTGRLSGKVAVETGAGQGIGRAIALAMAREGALVVAGDISGDGLAETAQLGGGRIETMRCDVTIEDDVNALVARAVETRGGLDVMCNNAGVLETAPLIETTEDRWNRVIDVSLRGTFFGVKSALKAILRGGRSGSIINLGSTNSFVGERDSSAYVASKGGVLTLTNTAAAEAAPHGIRVNAVCPGATGTRLLAGYNDAIGGAEKAEAVMRIYQP
ncbi:MAG: SDR family NAD(P)-dependent oxidoreductase, partial [Rhodococcus sp. (in: high G+C Gram-positive bacteria)]